jgi:hypothetical protein
MASAHTRYLVGSSYQGQRAFLTSFADRDSKTKKTYWFTRPDSQKGSRGDIPQAAKNEFAKKEITCGTSLPSPFDIAASSWVAVEYTDLQPGTEREIFQRVQLGMTLTVAGMCLT